MSEKDLKLTDLDYATGDHHLQMMKAALPYLDIRRQRSLSMFIRAREMMHTMEFFRENDDGMMSVCSLESPNPSVEDMLSAVRPYANKAEQDTIDMISRFLASRRGRSGFRLTPEQLFSILPPDMQAQYETLQLVMQSFAPRICPWNNMIRKDPGNQIRGSITWMRKRSLYWLPSPMNWPQPQKLKE